MGVVQMGELREDFHHLVGALPAGNHDDDVGLGLLGDSVLQHRLTRTERPGNESRTAVGYRIESIYRPDTGFEYARRTRLGHIRLDGTLHRPLLHHRHRMFPALRIFEHGHSMVDIILSCSGHAADGIATLERERHHYLVHYPLLLHLAEPVACLYPVARFGQRTELPECLLVQRRGTLPAPDEQTVHIGQVVLQPS